MPGSRLLSSVQVGAFEATTIVPELDPWLKATDAAVTIWALEKIAVINVGAAFRNTQ